jgi:hypothetical protein
VEPKVINVSANGVISVKIDADKFPQSVAGNVWRYLPTKEKDGKAGFFNSHIKEIPLGAPADINEKFFLLRAVVISQNDNPPTPYQLIVSVLQNGQELAKEVPENGSGPLGKEDIVVDYKFQIVAQ